MKIAALVVLALATGGADFVEVDPPVDGWEVEALIGEMSDATGESIIIDGGLQKLRRMKVRLTGGARPVPRSRLFSFYRSLLWTHRIKIVPLGPAGSEQWVALEPNSPFLTVRPNHVLPEDLDDWAGRDGAYVTSSISLGGLTDTPNVRKSMAWIATHTIGRVNDIPSVPCLVVAEYAPMAAVMNKLIRTMRGESVKAAPRPAIEGADDPILIPARTGGTPIEEVLGTVSRHTGEAFLYDPRYPVIARMRVEWSGDLEIPRGELLDWLRSMMFFHRLVLVPAGEPEDRIWLVVDINSPQAGSRPVFVPPDEVADWADRGGAYIATAIAVPHIEDTARVQNALKRYGTRTISRVADVPGDRWFVVADYAPNVAWICGMLREMDEAARK